MPSKPSAQTPSLPAHLHLRSVPSSPTLRQRLDANASDWFELAERINNAVLKGLVRLLRAARWASRAFALRPETVPAGCGNSDHGFRQGAAQAGRASRLLIEKNHRFLRKIAQTIKNTVLTIKNHKNVCKSVVSLLGRCAIPVGHRQSSRFWPKPEGMACMPVSLQARKARRGVVCFARVHGFACRSAKTSRSPGCTRTDSGRAFAPPAGAQPARPKRSGAGGH